MREIEAKAITKTIARLCQEANFELGEDVISALKQAQETEESELGRETLDKLLENARIGVVVQIVAVARLVCGALWWVTI